MISIVCEIIFVFLNLPHIFKMRQETQTNKQTPLGNKGQRRKRMETIKAELIQFVRYCGGPREGYWVERGDFAVVPVGLLTPDECGPAHTHKVGSCPVVIADDADLPAGYDPPIYYSVYRGRPVAAAPSAPALPPQQSREERIREQNYRWHEVYRANCAR